MYKYNCNKYGQAAMYATELYHKNKAATPTTAWETAVIKIFQNSASSQNKGCPRGAYLGLCESGAITRIPKGNYCKSDKNKHYAVKALHILKNSSSPPPSAMELWKKVTHGEAITHNNQMDVVLCLWHKGYIG